MRFRDAVLWLPAALMLGGGASSAMAQGADYAQGWRFTVAPYV